MRQEKESQKTLRDMKIKELIHSSIQKSGEKCCKLATVYSHISGRRCRWPRSTTQIRSSWTRARTISWSIDALDYCMLA